MSTIQQTPNGDPSVLPKSYQELAEKLGSAEASRVMRGKAVYTFEIPKRGTTETRTVEALESNARTWMKQVNAELQSEAKARGIVHPKATGFVPRKGNNTAARLVHNRHGKQAFGLVSQDLKSAFPNVSEQRVREALREVGLTGFELHSVTKATCHKGHLATGSPVSPLILNIVLREMDDELEKLAKRWAGTYTRYADDLSITTRSTNRRKIARLKRIVQAIIRGAGAIPHPKKNAAKVVGRHPSEVGEVVGVMLHNEHARKAPKRLKRKLRALDRQQTLHGLCENPRYCSLCLQAEGLRKYVSFITHAGRQRAKKRGPHLDSHHQPSLW